MKSVADSRHVTLTFEVLFEASRRVQFRIRRACSPPKHDSEYPQHLELLAPLLLRYSIPDLLNIRSLT